MTSAQNVTQVPPTLKQKIGTFLRQPIVVIILVVVVAALLTVQVWTGNAAVTVIFLVIGGILGIAKEVLAAFVADQSKEDEIAAACNGEADADANIELKAVQKKKQAWTERAIVCSIYSAVFAFPGLVAGAIALLVK